MSDILSRQEDSYRALHEHQEGAFLQERPAMFSPAAAAQDEGNWSTTVKRFGPLYLPMEYTTWVDETSAHVTSAYLGDWTSLAKIAVHGRQALDFLNHLGMNDLSVFPVGRVKHHVHLDDNGWVASEGVLLREGEDRFLYTAGSADWLLWQLGNGTWDASAEDLSAARFIFGLQGPVSADILDGLVEGTIRDLAFNASREMRLAGYDVRILRTGISGEIGFEIHGRSNDADAVWRAVRDAGEPLGLLQLGFRSQPVQHIEAGIATNGLDYFPSSAITPAAPWQFRRGPVGGSFVPAAFTDYFRTPSELGWDRGGDYAHDFRGREAFLAQRSTSRVLRGLSWNSDDVAEILAAPVREGEQPEFMELPRVTAAVYDTVTVDGQPVGVSSGRTLSTVLRRTISLVTIDRDYAAEGTEVTVVWGHPGSNQRLVRATVTELPFKPDRRRASLQN